ncbi:YlxR family protein [Microbacterium protaetiae]|uniref:YlxR family protein n=1 Tax=Microbacterium protaetiae TaxID=2509458 RepID=A0A4P6EEL3_9MICO|nr:YlxR family protein [Microbacterium protaetiae]QAY60745.1 YlxR family protein [Microbacterium protaetiae]
MEPVRTCVGCRQRSARSALLRVVAIDSHLVPDERATMPGRGAWVHDTYPCLDAALRRRAFVRALRVSGPLDAQTIEKRLNGYGNKVNGSK